MTHFKRKENLLFSLLLLIPSLALGQSPTGSPSLPSESGALTGGTLSTSGSIGTLPSSPPTLPPSPHATPTKMITLSVVDPSPKTTFENTVSPPLRSQLNGCKACDVLNLTPYDGAGQFKEKNLLESLDRVPEKQSVLVLLYNRKFFPKEDEELVKKIKILIEKGVVVIATAGRPKAKEPTLSLNRTLWGQIPEILLIGELEGGERLVAGTFYGPELLTAMKPSPEFPGTDRGALQFAVRFLPHLKSREAHRWPSLLREKKSKIRQFWPRLEDLLKR